MRRLAIWIVVLAGIAVLAIAAFVRFSGDGPFVVYRYRTMCEKPQGFIQAAARSAQAPHPVFIPDYWDIRRIHQDMFTPAELDIWEPTDPAKVELVACVADVGRGEFVTKCDYTGDSVFGAGDASGTYTVNLYKEIYRVSLFEASTGKSVASAQIAADNFGPDEKQDADPCAFSISVRAGASRSTDRPGTPYIRQIQDVLAPYVTG